MKKTAFTLFLHFTLFTLHCFAQQGQWTWMNGSNVSGAPAVYGTQGVFAPGNTPPGTYENCEWTDLSGNFWLLSSADNHLWEFKSSINQWAWIAPSANVMYGIYGTQNIPSPANFPGKRGTGSVGWTDTSGNLWLFGGGGYAASTMGTLSDLWMYNITTNEWTWMAGSNTANDPGTYGTILIPAPTNNPPSRTEFGSRWIDNNNGLWLFGGEKYGGGYLSDLWKFNISTNEWTWMKGPNTINQPAVYGTKGVSNPANVPGARWSYSHWKDSNGNFWLFGGAFNFFSRNDMWRFNPTTNDWTWMSGTNITEDSGTSGTQCVPDTANIPTARWENRACWTRPCDNFELFGGSGQTHRFNDLWNYNVSTNQWTWMSGTVLANNLGNYGTITVSSPTNVPPWHFGNSTWLDNSGNLWMFGGYCGGGYINDMWRFVPDSSCPYITGTIVVTSAFNALPINGCNPLTVTFTNNSINGTSYLWNFGDNVTSNSANPTHIYSNPGTYTVYLIANTTCSIHPDTSTQIITVFSSPTPTIIGDSSICFGGSSTLNSGSFSQYHWSTGSSTQTISVNTSGTYSITVTNSNGCTGTASQTVIVNPNPTPFILGDSSICQGDSSLLDAGSFAQYHWSTGSLTQTINVNTTNNYIVTVTNTFGCTGTAQKIITVNANANSAFTADTLTGCSPLTVTFINNSTNSNQYLWNFGNTDTSIVSNPSYIYDSSGIYTITLIAYGAGGCNDTMIHSNYITILSLPIVTSSFTAVPLSGCNPLTVLFNNTSTNGITYLWNFGDNNTSTFNNTSHTYDSSGTFVVKLFTTNTSICGVVTDSSTDTITVYPQAHASFVADTLTGCSPFTVNFINGSSNAASYYWDLGNNNHSTITNPSFIYDSSGIYTITLIAYGVGGCNDTMVHSNYITILSLPIVTSLFVADTLSGCNPITINFTNTSSNGITYLWNFGDSITATSMNATHVYNDSGTFNITLIATNNSPCGVVKDTFIQQSLIRVDEPIKVTSNFSAEPLTGCSPLVVDFTNSSTNGASYYWFFGDGGIDSIKNPIHIFDSGTYHVYLIAYNNTNRCYNAPDSTGLLITVENCELSIPNTFTPNNDGKNDFFDIIADGYTNYHLIIFNRWGLKIFESTNKNILWNGKVNNTGSNATDGTYYYIFTANDVNGKPLSLKGFITLIR